MMSRKDYIAIAAALKSACPEQTEPAMDHMGVRWLDMLRGWSDCINAIASVLADDNDRFDRARFLAACGVES